MKENAIEVMDRRTLVFEALKNDIINGNIRFGEKINENEYSIRYNISRTPLREALSKLEMMGIIERVPFKGVFLKKFNSEKVKEIYEIRLELEYIIYKEIKEIMTDKHIKKGQKYNNSNNLAKFSETLEEFDNYLYSLSKKELSLKILSELSFYMNIFKKTNPNMQETVDEHEKIIEALKEKDDEKIYKALEEHLYNAANYVVKKFDKISI